MYIILIGSHSATITGNEILSCSAIIVLDKKGLKKLIEEDRITDRSRVFKITKEIRVSRETTLVFGEESDKDCVSFTCKEVLSGE